VGQGAAVVYRVLILPVLPGFRLRHAGILCAQTVRGNVDIRARQISAKAA